MYTAGEFAKRLGVKTEQLRDWRRRGFLENIGKDIRGRWEYSDGDLLVLTLAQAFRDKTGDLERSITISLWSLHFYRARDLGENVSRYLFFFEVDGEDGVRKMRMIHADDINLLARKIEADDQAAIGIWVDCDSILRLVSPDLFAKYAGKTLPEIPFRSEAEGVIFKNA